jgi:hypothetical protein
MKYGIIWYYQMRESQINIFPLQEIMTAHLFSNLFSDHLFFVFLLTKYFNHELFMYCTDSKHRDILNTWKYNWKPSLLALWPVKQMLTLFSHSATVTIIHHEVCEVPLLTFLKCPPMSMSSLNYMFWLEISHLLCSSIVPTSLHS